MTIILIVILGEKKMSRGINGKTPLLHAHENPFDGEEKCQSDSARQKHITVSNSKSSFISRSFSAESESSQFGDGATLISYHDVGYTVYTKEKGIKTEKHIIKNLRCNHGLVLSQSLFVCDYNLHCFLNKILTFLRAVYLLNEKHSVWGNYQGIYPGWMED